MARMLWPDLASFNATLGALFSPERKLIGFFLEPVENGFDAALQKRLRTAGFELAGLEPERWEREGVRIGYDELKVIFPGFDPARHVAEVFPRRRERLVSLGVEVSSEDYPAAPDFAVDFETGQHAHAMEPDVFERLAGERIVTIGLNGSPLFGSALRARIAAACGEPDPLADRVDYQIARMLEMAREALQRADTYAVYGVGQHRFSPPIRFFRAENVQASAFADLDRLREKAREVGLIPADRSDDDLPDNEAELEPDEAAAEVDDSEAFDAGDDDSPVGYRQARRRRAAEERIEDYGEKIGGARKDLYLRGKDFNVEVLPELTLKEIRDAARLPSVWPFSWNEARDRGVEPDVAAWIYMFRRSLKTLDKATHYSAFYDIRGESKEEAFREAARRYILAVGKLRDTFAEVRTEADLRAAALQLQQGFIKAGEMVVEQRGYSTRLTFSSWMPEAVAVAMRHPSIGIDLYKGEIWGAGWASLKMGLKGRGYPYGGSENLTVEEKWERIVGKTTPARKPKSEGPTIPERPHLDHLRFEGLPVTREGDVTPEMFSEHFGFRAIEFGEWLPQGERQVVLNRAWDALDSLARVMGMEPRMMSLGGRLAAAFGSRGKGKALAHYEPDRRVFNLTRLKGAGALAHEYGHAFDHWLADTLRAADPRQIGKLAYLSETQTFTDLKARLVTPEEEEERAMGIVRSVERGAADRSQIASFRIMAGMARAVRAMVGQFVPVDHEATASQLERDAAQRRAWARNWIGNAKFMSKHYPESRARYEAAEAMVDAAIESVRYSTDEMFRQGEVRHEAFDSGKAHQEVIDRMARMGFPASKSTRVTNALLANLASASHYMARAEFCHLMPEERDLAMQRPGSVHYQDLYGLTATKSEFVAEAGKLDELRSSPYWNTGRELFARAFEAWVFDRLEERGAKSEYLVHGVEADRFSGSGYGGNPYPVGEERECIGEAMDDLMGRVVEHLEIAPYREPCERIAATKSSASVCSI